MSNKKFIICCSKLWDPEIALDLTRTTGHEFILLQKKEELTPSFLKESNPTAVFFPHWSYIIPRDIHENYRCVIFHMTDLPYGRGGSPLQNLIIRGHLETKISALICTAGVDEGDILLKKSLSLKGSAEVIFHEATRIIKDMILEIIIKNPTPQKQLGEATHFKRRTPQESNIEDSSELLNAYDRIRMVDSDLYPRAFLRNSGGLIFEFSEASLEGDKLIAKVRIKK